MQANLVATCQEMREGARALREDALPSGRWRRRSEPGPTPSGRPPLCSGPAECCCYLGTPICNASQRRVPRC